MEFKNKLPYGQKYMTMEGFRKYMKIWGREDECDEKVNCIGEIVTSMGIYNVEKGIFYSWLIGVSDDRPGR